MNNSFYGNNSNLSITFDKIYPNKNEMMQDIDNIFLNRYVFINYNFSDYNNGNFTYDNNVEIDGNEFNHLTVWRKSLVNNSPTFIKIGCFDLSQFNGVEATLDYNQNGFDFEKITIIPPETDNSNKIIVQGNFNNNGETILFKFDISAIGNAIAEMWNIVYDKDATEERRLTNIGFNHDEDKRTYNLETLAGCINTCQKFIGREVFYSSEDGYNQEDMENIASESTKDFLIFEDRSSSLTIYYKVLTGKIAEGIDRFQELTNFDLFTKNLYCSIISTWELAKKAEDMLAGAGQGMDIGKSLENKLVYPDSSPSVTAKEGSEIFNDYRERKQDNLIQGNIAVGEYSHAEGSCCTAIGDYSHAEGFYTKAEGESSHSAGKGTVALGENQTVIGRYNSYDSNNEYAFIIGNGYEDSSGATVSQRSNAMTVDWEGNIKLNNQDLFNLIYPIGSIYMSVNNINPQYLFGGTWELWGSGKVPIGVDPNNRSFNTAENTGGSSTHTLTAAQLPSHTHTIGAHKHGLNNHVHSIPKTSATATTSTAGSHNHDIYCNNTTSSGSANRAIGNGESHTGEFSNAIQNAGNHSHSVTVSVGPWGTGSASGDTADSSVFNSGATGSGSSFSLLPPYITCYMWKRTGLKQ